jgi:hypothetical protein
MKLPPSRDYETWHRDWEAKWAAIDAEFDKRGPEVRARLEVITAKGVQMATPQNVREGKRLLAELKQHVRNADVKKEELKDEINCLIAFAAETGEYSPEGQHRIEALKEMHQRLGGAHGTDTA